jgi:hypothetical protein
MANERSGIHPRSLAMSGNWRTSTWLGTYYNYPSSHWIYANGLGYAYVAPVSEVDWESVHTLWMYLDDPAFGWSWTDVSSWPWAWVHTKGWVYYLSDGWFWVCDAQRYEQIVTGAVAYSDGNH